MNPNQAFTINGINGKQASVVRTIQQRSYIEGNLNAGSSAAAGLSAGFASFKLATWLRGMVVAAETPAVAMAVAEGTIAATLLTTVVPIVAGTAIGIGVGYGIKYIGEKLINDNKHLNLDEALANGQITLIETEEQRKQANEDCTGIMLFTNNPLLQRLHAKKAAAEKAAAEAAATPATADKSSGDAAQAAPAAA